LGINQVVTLGETMNGVLELNPPYLQDYQNVNLR